jgi:hypothetical protein
MQDYFATSRERPPPPRPPRLLPAIAGAGKKRKEDKQ